MSEENKLIVKQKLNFFQRLKKKQLIKKINILKYEKSPEYLKYDEEVILALIFQNPSNMLKFPMEKRLQILKLNPVFFNDLPTDEKYNIIKTEPSFINNLQLNDILVFINRSDNMEYIKYLPEEIQTDLLTKANIFYENSPFSSTPLQSSIYPSRFSKKLEFFSPDVVEKVAIMLINKAQQNKNYSNWEYQRRSEPLLNDMDISTLSTDRQIRLGLLDVGFLKSMSEEAAKKYVGNNPLLMKNLSSDMQIKIIRNNPQMMSCLPPDIKYNILKSDSSLSDVALDEYKADFGLDNTKLTNVKVIKKKLAKMFDRNLYIMSKLIDSLRDPKDLIDVGQFEPLVFTDCKYNLSPFQKIEHINKIFKMFKTFINNPEIIAELDRFQQNSTQMNAVDRDNTTIGFAKLLLNETIMNKVEPNLISKIMRNPKDGELLKSIVEQAYGEQARKVLEERPSVTLQQIPNFYIFDPVIFEKFGEGAVNNALSYDSSANCVLGELAKNPEKLRKFEEFKKLFGEEKEDVVGFNNKLVAFENLQELLFNIDIKNLNEMQKNNLLLVYNDMFMDLKTNSGMVVSVKTLEDIDSYIDSRNKIYDDYFKKSCNETDIKDAISRRFFGMNYEDRINPQFTHTHLSLNSMVHYYNLEEFTSDERTISSGNFTQDELDMLELAKIITNIHNPRILKEIYEELSQREDVLTPLDFAKARDKVPMLYSKELVDSLLTVDKAKEKIKNGEKGISLETTEDGLDIIKLNGASFRIMLHTTGLNNSGLQISRNNDLADTWKNFEEGCSTISTCVIEPEMLRSCKIDGYTNFGFANIPEKQIVGMSHHDAHVTHSKKIAEPYFDYTSVMYNYPDELIRKTAAQITGQEIKDASHEYNEVTMYRKHIDAKKQDSYGKRVMPDYIVVYGEANDKHKKLARSFARPDGKPIPIIEIDTRVYGDRVYQRGNKNSKENHTIERENGEILKTVKEILNNNLDH